MVVVWEMEREMLAPARCPALSPAAHGAASPSPENRERGLFVVVAWEMEREMLAAARCPALSPAANGTASPSPKN